MNAPADLPTFESLALILEQANAGCSAPELHGLMTGLLAGGARLNRNMLIKVLETHASPTQPFSETVQHGFWQLQLQTLEDLGSSELIFQPLLPDDEEDLALRVTALSDWCQGFLVGFGTAIRPDDARIHEESIRETLQDIVHVSHVDAAAQDNDEGDENAYAELYEFVRMAVIHLFEELAPPEESRQLDHHTPDDNPTLH